MSDTALPKTPFGVTGVLGETFSTFGKKFPYVLILCFIPMIFSLGMSVLVFGPELALGQATGDPADPFAGVDLVGFAVTYILQIIATALATAMMVLLAYDARIGRPVRLGEYISVALRNIVPLTVLSIVVYLLGFVAMLALIVPGIWLFAVWSVVIPVIVVEGAGFGALGRSAALTKEYRWPIIGTMVIMVICMVIISLGMTFVVVPVVMSLGIIVAIIAQALISAVTFGLICVAVALIYARLRELKEGISVEALADVFS